MNKSHFIEFVENPSTLREKDADILAELARNYPYSSLVHTLLARALKGTARGKESLAAAALHIPDRSVLKEVMENSLLKSPPVPIEAEAVDSGKTGLLPGTQANFREKAEPAPFLAETEAKTDQYQAQEEDSSAFPEQPDISEQPGILEELQRNLQELKEQRDRFHLEQDNETESGGEQPKAEADQAPAEESSSFKEIPVKQLPERLQEIVKSHAELEIVDPKRIEQNDLIDSFILKSSSIARKYRSPDEEEKEQNDLTDQYHFTPQDLATENLAKIMIRQGKTDKAIDIYQKLVLKYPQKKAYFATCIEKLKNTQ